MPILEIITIGTELLLGEITDTNSTYIARTLRDHGIDIYRITTIGDNPKRITSTIQEALTRSDIIITTGGLGPTVDDPTRQAVADAFSRELEFSNILWDQIIERFNAFGRVPTENNRRQAYIPQGSVPVSNPVGTAPCFIVEQDSACVITLPGVPPEMETILHQSIIPYLKEKYHLESHIIKATVLHTSGLGESIVDEAISDLEKLSNPSVGLLAHPGQVDIRITAKASSELEAIEMINPIVEELFRRLGEHIYGKDQDTLESVIDALLAQHNLKLGIIEQGFTHSLCDRLSWTNVVSKQYDKLVSNLEHFVELVVDFCRHHQMDAGFGLALLDINPTTLFLVYHYAKFNLTKTLSYGGPPKNAQRWAQNTGLDFLRQNLTTRIKTEPKESYETG